MSVPQPQFDREPYLSAAFLCQRVLVERDNVKSVIRIVDRLTRATQVPTIDTPMAPFEHRLFLFFRFKSGWALFNESPDPQMIAEGRLAPVYLRDDHLRDPEKRGQIQCTRAQTIRYVDEAGEWVAVVFQYKRPDGAIGVSGKPDPKRLRVGGVIYALEPEGSAPSDP